MSKTATVLRMGVAILAISTALNLLAQPSGKHYRWKDAEGNVHYSDRPPEGIESELIKISTGRHSKASEQGSKEVAGNGQQKAGNEPKKMEALPEKDPKLCKQAQDNLKALASARIRITEPDGSRRILTEEEKEEQRANARKFIELHCD